MKTILIFISVFLGHAWANSDHYHHDHHHKKQSPSVLGAHVHGELECSLAVDGKEVYIQLQSPAESLLGFEHKPKTQKERQRWNQLKNSWKKNLFQAFSISNLECQVFEPHIILHVDDKGQHAQIHTEAQLRCPEDLKQKSLKLNLPEHFEAIQKIRIEVLPSADSPYTKSLEGKQKSIELKL